MSHNERVKFAVLVRIDDSGNWYRGPQRFTTREEGDEYGRNLYHRWRAVREWMVVQMPDE